MNIEFIIAVIIAVIAILAVGKQILDWIFKRFVIWHNKVDNQLDYFEIAIKSLIDWAGKQDPEIFKMIVQNREEMKELSKNPHSLLGNFISNMQQGENKEKS